MRLVTKMPAKYTIAERTELVLLCGLEGVNPQTFTAVSEQFHLRHPDRDRPHVSTISNLLRKFQATGSVHDDWQACGRPRSSTDEEHTLAVIESVEETPRISQRSLAQQLNTNQTAINRIHREQGYHGFKPATPQHLDEEDFDRRLQFAQWAVETIDADPTFLRHLVIIEAAHLALHVLPNKRNTR